MCLFLWGGEKECFFVFVSRILRVGEWMGERVSGFFHSSQNEETGGNLCRMVVFYQNTFGRAFYYNIKIKYYINLFIISKISNYTINNNIQL